MKIFFDGGCRPNPGPIEAAVVVRGIAYFFDDLGTGSSSEAEWSALIAAVRLANDLDASTSILLGDSAHVIVDANRLVARRMLPATSHHLTFLDLVGTTPPRLRWTPRKQNLAGIALERRRSGLSRP